MILDVLLLIAALVILAKASGVTIDNALKLSKHSGVSPVMIGFVVIAISTSLPELLIAIISSSSGEGLISMGNIFGSSIGDMALVFGLMALYGFKITKFDWEEIDKITILTCVLTIFVIALGRLDFVVGFFLLIMFYGFSRTVFMDGGESERIAHRDWKKIAALLAIVVASAIVVVVAAKLVVDTTISISQSLGIAEAALGATVIALGTMLPELSISLSALRKKNIDLAVGDLTGSVVTNMSLVLGVATIINPIALNLQVIIAGLFMLLVGMVLIAMARRRRFGAGEGITLLSIYAIYIMVMILVGHA